MSQKKSGRRFRVEIWLECTDGEIKPARSVPMSERDARRLSIVWQAEGHKTRIFEDEPIGYLGPDGLSGGKGR